MRISYVKNISLISLHNRHYVKLVKVAAACCIFKMEQKKWV